MADIPSLESSVAPSVQPGADLPMVASEGAYGGDVAQSLGRLGSVNDTLHQRAVQSFNQTSVFDAMNAVHEHVQKVVFDPQNGLLAQPLGKQAPGAVDQTLSDFDAKVGEISDGLTNPAQKEAFSHQATEQRYGLEQHLNHYESQQLTAYEEATLKATLANSVTGAVNSYELPAEGPLKGGLDHSVDTQVAALTDYAATHGIPKVVLDQQIMEAKSATYAAVANDALTKNNTEFVRNLMAEHGDDMDPRQRYAINRELKQTDLLGESQRQADAIVGRAGAAHFSDDSGYDLQGAWDQARAEAAKITDPQVRERASALINQEFHQQYESKRGSENQAMDSALKLVSAGQAVPPATMMNLSGEQRLSIQRLQVRTDTVQATPHEMQSYLQAREWMADPENVDAVRLKHVGDWVNDMTPAHLQDLQMMKEGIGRGKSAAEVDPEHGVALANIHDAIEEAGITATYKAGAPDNANNALLRQLHFAYFRAIDAENSLRQQQKKAPLTASEQRDIANKLLVKTVTGPWYWSTTTYAFEHDAKVPTVALPSEVPRDFRERAQQRNPLIDPRVLVEQYNASLRDVEAAKTQAVPAANQAGHGFRRGVGF